MKRLLQKSFGLLCVSCMAILMLFGLIACSGDDKPFMDREPVSVVTGGDIVKGISVTLSDFETADAQTRTAYSSVDSGVKVTWASNDTIGIFPNEGGQVEFPIQAGTESNEATFDGGGWALKSNSTYAAYYPYRNANGDYGNQRIQLKYTGQKQAANGSTAHLGQYDYQATGGVQTNSSGYLNFQFKHLGALMVFNLTVPKAGTYTSLTLSSSEEVFVTKAELDISGNEPVLKPIETSSTFTLSLDDIELESDNSELTTYMMLAPVDLSQGTLKLYLNGSTNFLTTLNGHSLESGKQYTINSSLSYLDYENIEFADENVKAICVENWDTNKDGELSYGEAATVTDIGNKFNSKTEIKSFDEFQYFTGVTSIGDYAFERCSSLTSIVIPEGVTSIGGNAFSGCSSLTSIVIPEGVTSIGEDTFYGCSSLTSIEIPDGVKSIGRSAFLGCSSLTSINIPDGVKSIGTSAFSECSSLTSIVIPEGVTSIGGNAFSGCSSLTSIVVDKNNNYYDSRNDCNAIIETNRNTLLSGCVSTVIPKGVKSIGTSAFSGCSSLTSIKIPEGVTSIGSSAFWGCSSLTSIVIPEGVTSIGYDTFYGCYSLTSIVIPEGVTSIGNSAFYSCSSLTSIEIPEGVTSIGISAFSGCSSLTSIVIPEGVTSIGESAFRGCSSLTSINIPDGVTSIGIFAFSECSSLTNIEIPKGVTSIDDCSFYGCSSLTSIVIPEGVTSIRADAFSECSSLTSIVIPESVVSIGRIGNNDYIYIHNYGGTFYGCSLLNNITCLAANPPTFYNIFGGQQYQGTIYVPITSVDAYKAAEGWKKYASQIKTIPE